LERIDLALEAPMAETPPRLLVVGVAPDDQPAALQIARQLRTLDGVAVEQDVRMRGVKAALRYADRADIDLAVIVGERERSDRTCVLRNMRSRAEATLAQDELLDAVRRALR
jgi:histidyl-tRNA synthetase